MLWRETRRGRGWGVRKGVASEDETVVFILGGAHVFLFS